MAASRPNLSELIAQLPETDRDLEAAQKNEPARGQASKFTGPDPQKAEALLNALLAGGADTVRELIASVREPADPEFKSYKAEYALTMLATYVGRPGKEPQRALVTGILQQEIGNAQLAKPVRALLVRTLQRSGDAGAVPALSRLLLDEDLCDPAAMALATIGEGAAEAFRAALPQAKGRCRRVLVHSLGAVRDAQSTPVLETALGDSEAEVRLAAAWALAQSGNPAAIPALLKAAEVTTPYERVKITDACLALAEALVRGGKRAEAARIYAYLVQSRTDPKERYVRDAARKAMDRLGTVAPS